MSKRYKKKQEKKQALKESDKYCEIHDCRKMYIGRIEPENKDDPREPKYACPQCDATIYVKAAELEEIHDALKGVDLHGKKE